MKPKAKQQQQGKQPAASGIFGGLTNLFGGKSIEDVAKSAQQQMAELTLDNISARVVADLKKEILFESRKQQLQEKTGWTDQQLEEFLVYQQQKQQQNKNEEEGQ